MQIPSQTRNVLRFAPFELDLSSGELHKHGIKIRLQEQPFQVLAMLLERPGQVVTREELRQKLWHSDTFVDFDVGLNSAIVRLRASLADSADRPRFIETLPRRGYRFIALVERDGSRDSKMPAATPGIPAPAAITSERTRPATRRLLVLGICAASVIVVSVLFASNIGGLRDRSLGAPARPTIHSIVVLPLDNLTGDAAQEYFADGMTDALTTELAQTAPVRVISRTSAMQYKGKHQKLSNIAQELNVDAVVEGSVARSGDRVRITAQLIHTATDRHLWAQSYERDLSDVLALQRDISRAIANEVEIKLSKDQQRELTNMRRVNADAYEAYLRGKLYLDTPDARENETAIAMLERSTVLDPGFALAQAGLARAYLFRYFMWDPDKVWTEKAAQATQRALSLDPQLPDAYLARAQLELFTSPLPYQEAVAKAAKDFRHALSLNPSLVDAHARFGGMCLQIGLLQKALEEFQAAVALDPRNLWVLYRIPRVHMYQQQYAMALTEFERRGFSPDWQRALVLQYLGRTSEAFEFIEKLEKVDKDLARQADVASTHAVLLAARGEKKRAEEKIRIAIETGQGKLHFYHAEYNIASAYALMGKNQLAMKWLRNTAGGRFQCYPLFEKDPNLNNLRNDPDFAAFMQQMRLQWEHYKSVV